MKIFQGFKQSTVIALWFMFLTFPILVIRVNTIEKVIEWAQNELPTWQSDAVRRLLTQDDLTTQDKSELLAMVKEKHGLGNLEKPAPIPVPVAKGKISGVPQEKVNIVLKKIDNFKNHNNIYSFSK